MPACVLAEHANVALEYAQAAEQVLEGEPKAHMSEAVKHGNMDQVDIATEHLDEAITHIKALLGE